MAHTTQLPFWALTAGDHGHHPGYSSPAVEEPLHGIGSGLSRLSGGNSHPPVIPRTGPWPGKAESASVGQGDVRQMLQAGGTTPASSAPSPGSHQALVLTVDADMAFSQYHMGDVLEVTEVGPQLLLWPVHRLDNRLLGLGFLPR